MQKKKKLLQLISDNFNRSSARIDIGLHEELATLKGIIDQQEQTKRELAVKLA